MGVFFLSACQKDDQAGPPAMKEGDNFVLYTSERLYKEAIAARASDPGTPFDIVEVELQEKASAKGHNVLRAVVRHPAGCDGQFVFYWDGAVMESSPEQVNILLKLPATCEGNDEMVETELYVDLYEFLGQLEFTDRIMVHLINGSRLSTSNDQNVSSN